MEVSAIFIRKWKFGQGELNGFEVLTEVGTKMGVFWDVAPWSLGVGFPCHRPDNGGSKVL
jgi:hypothetical protein